MDIVEDLEELREIYGPPGERSVKKQLTRFDKHCRAFIARSPLLVMASSDPSGRCDASPKGDAPGFVQVLDDQTLLIPDRLGNNRVDTIGNLLVRPRQGDSRYADLREIVEHLVVQKKLQTPILLRFPQLLESQLRKLHAAYSDAAREFGYQGSHYPVFPMKVNPRREVVEEFLRASQQTSCGLECGSKAELYAALAM